MSGYAWGTAVVRRAVRPRVRPRPSDAAGWSGDALEKDRGLTGLRAITYNCWHGRGERDLAELVARERPDLLALQEVSDTLPERIGPLRRAVHTDGRRFGVALLVDEDRFDIEEAAALQVPRSGHDRLMRTTAERVGAARLLDRETGRPLLAGTIHATPLTDPNVVRRRQIAAALEGIDRLGPALPLLLAGDLNHPWFLGGLERRLASRGRTLVRSDVGTFHGLGPRGPFDVAIVRGMTVESATTLPRRASDHRPVRFDLTLLEPPRG